VIWIYANGVAGLGQKVGGLAIDTMAKWLDAIASDTSGLAAIEKIKKAKPATAVDGCWDAESHRIDEPATFDGPGRAIECALAIRDSVRSLGLEIRAGLHTGECERVDGKLGGIAVPTGARIAGLADAGEVLVSQTVKDLVAGSGLRFDDRGGYELKGVPGTWRLYAVGGG